MKVVLIASAIPSLTDDAGTFTDNFARLLRASGDDVLVIVADPSQEQHKQPYQRWVSDLRHLGIDVASVFDNQMAVPNGYNLHAWQAKLIASLIPKDADIVYVGDRDARGLHLVRSRRFSREFAPTVVTVAHGSTAWLQETRAVVPSSEDDLWDDFGERYQAEYSDFILSPGQFMLDWVHNNNWALPDPDRQRVLGYPMLRYARTEQDNSQAPSVPSGLSRALTAQTRALGSPTSLSRDPDLHRIVFVGPLDGGNGIQDFTDAIQDLQVDELLRSVREIVLIGTKVEPASGKRDAIVRLKQIINEDVAVDVVLDADLASLEECLAKHKDSTLVVFPDRQANYSYPLFLAASIGGLGVIAANVGSNAEILGQSRHEQLFEPFASQLTAKIGECLRAGTRHWLQPSEPVTLSNQRWLDFHREAGAFTKEQRTSHRQAQLASAAEQPTERISTTNKSVDICIPYFNLGSYLPYMLESLAKQTCDDFNVFIVNDGSTSPEAVKTFEQMAHKYENCGWHFVTTPNRGVCEARNAAARLGTADFIVFVDADDIVAPTLVERFLEAIRHSDDDCLTCYMHVFRGEGWEESYSRQQLFTYVPCGNAPILGLTINAFGGECFIVKRSAFEAIGGFTTEVPQHVGLEDYDFFLRLSLGGYRLDVVPEILLHYRRRHDGRYHATTGNLYNRYSATMRLMRNYEQQLNPVGLGGLATYAMGIYSRLSGNGFSSQEAAAWHQQQEAWIAQLQEAVAWHQQQSQYWKRIAIERSVVQREIRPVILHLRALLRTFYRRPPKG